MDDRNLMENLLQLEKEPAIYFCTAPWNPPPSASTRRLGRR